MIRDDRFRWRCRLMLALLLAMSSPATARPDKAKEVAEPAAESTQSVPENAKDEEEKSERLNGEVEDASVTTGEVTIANEAVSYRATAAKMPMKGEDGELKATMFFIAYERLAESAELADSDENGESEVRPLAESDPSQRPLTFVFNGGPGAASVWLHLGTAGPKVIHLEPDGRAPAPPYKLVDNKHSWLAATDMVFIDPVGTGYSRPAKGEKGDQFYGTQQDIQWVGEFIRLYLTKYKRWLSPLFLAGESYGTTRAAGLSEHLLDRHGINLNGIIFVSTVLNFQTLRPAESNDLPYVLFLPAYTATAFYHDRLSDRLQRDLERTLEQVREWSVEEYLPALTHGSALSPDESSKIAERLAEFTSLDAEAIERMKLRISPWVFRKRVLGDEAKVVGRFDSRIVGPDIQPEMSWPGFDPSLSHYLPVYSATFNDYVRRTLEYKSVLPYEVLSDKVRPWKYGKEGTGYLSVSDNLRSAMIKNPYLQAFFASGYYDLATPFFGTDYTINQLQLPDPMSEGIHHLYYQGGHMMYHNAETLARLGTDVRSFITEAAGL